MDNHTLVTEGFDTLLEALVPFEVQEFVKAYGPNDGWQRGVYDRLFEDQRRDLPRSGTGRELAGSLDVAKALLLLEINWNEVFRKVLPRETILSDVWGYDGGETRTLDNHVARLRKLGLNFETVFGVGYKFIAD